MCCEFSTSTEVFRDVHSSLLKEPFKLTINIAHNEIFHCS